MDSDGPLDNGDMFQDVEDAQERLEQNSGIIGKIFGMGLLGWGIALLVQAIIAAVGLAIFIGLVVFLLRFLNILPLFLF